jgi:hypothetical protein
LLSSGHSVGEILSTLGPVANTGDQNTAAGNPAAIEPEIMGASGSDRRGPAPKVSGIYDTAPPQEAKLVPILAQNSPGSQQPLVTAQPKTTISADQMMMGRSSDGDTSREEAPAPPHRGIPKKIPFWILCTTLIASGAIAMVSANNPMRNTNGTVEQQHEVAVVATADITGLAAGVPDSVGREPVINEPPHQAGALTSTELAVVPDSRPATLPLSEAARDKPTSEPSAAPPVALERTEGLQQVSVFGEPTANVAREPTNRLDGVAQELQFRSIVVAAGVLVVYPGSVFSQEQRTPDNLMVILHNKDRTAMLTISKGSNKGNELSSVRKFYEKLENAKVTYSLNRRNFFVLSGLKKDSTDEEHVFYFKRLLLRDEFAEIELQYPASQKPQYDRITEQISKSFVNHHAEGTRPSKKPDPCRPAADRN